MKLRVRLLVRLLVGLLVCSIAAQAQVAITNTIPSVCTSSTVSIPYSTSNTERFDILNLYAYLYRSTTDSIEIARLTNTEQIRNGAALSATIRPDQVSATDNYTIRLKLTRQPTVGNFTTYVSARSNVFTISAIPKSPSVVNLSACQYTTPPLIKSAVSDYSGTLNWYTTSPASTTVTPILSTSTAGSTSYSVSQSINGCESSRNTFTYTVNGLPDAPNVTYSLLSYCQNAQATSFPTSSNGNALTWYAVQTGGDPVTAPQTTEAKTTTYYVSQTNSNGCVSPRSNLTIQVNSRPALPQVTQNQPLAYCQTTQAASLSLSATALPGNTLKWYINADGPTLLTNLTPQTTATGTTSYYVSQTDGNGCESNRASITVRVDPKPVRPTVVNLSACLNTTPPTLPSAVTSFDGTLRWGTSPGSITLTDPPRLSSSAPDPNTYYVTQTNQYGCTSDPASISYTVKSLPDAPTVAPNPVVRCQSSGPVSLSATGVGTLTWYDSGNNVINPVLPNTNIAGRAVYQVTQTVDGCESLPASLTVVVIAKPLPPSLSSPTLSYCQLSPAVSLSATGQNLKWYMTLGRPASYTDKAPTPATDKAGTFLYYVTQTDNNSCESDQATITVQVKPKPANPGTPPLSFCANNATALTATPDPGGRLLWYGTTANPTGPTDTAPIPATGITGTPVTYLVSQVVDGCESDKANLDVTINALPRTPAVSTTPIYYCLNTKPIALSATPDQGGSLRWYYADGTPSTGPIEPQTTSSNPPTTYYYVSQVVNTCEGPRASIAVTINPLPPKPTVVASQTYCQGPASVTLSATATGTNTLTWYDQNGTPVSPIVSTANPGTTNYYVSQKVNQTDGQGCVSEQATIAVTITPTPRTPTSATVTYCLSTNATSLTATAPDGGQLNWYRADGTALGTAAPTPSTNATGPTIYYVSQSIGACEGQRATITVIVKPLPPKPTVISSLSLCQGNSSATLSATATGPLTWYAPDGTVTTTQTLPVPTSALGSRTYFVTQLADGCESLKESITVTITPQPSKPTVSTTLLTICQNTTPPVTLTATPSAGGSLNWYGTNPAGPASPALATAVATTAGTFTYYVSQTVNGCESLQAPIIVYVQATPGFPTIGPAPVYCQGGSSATPLSASASPGGTLNWYTTPMGGSPSPTPPPLPANASVSFTAYVSQSINGCEGPRTSLTATIRAAPNAPNPATFTFCQNTPATSLTAVANGGTLTWYDLPAGGSGSTIAPTPPTGSAITAYRFVSLTDSYGCESTRTTITIITNAQPNAPTTTALTFCQNTTPPPLTLSVGATGPLRWYANQSGGTPSPATPVPLAANAGPQTFFVSQLDAVTGCESPRSLLQVYVTPTPGAPTVQATAPTCQGPTPAVLTAGGQNLKWYADPTSTTPIYQGSTFNQSAIQSGPYAYYVSQTVSSCEGPRERIQGVVNPVPTPPAVTPALSSCQDAQVQPLTAVGTALQWYNQNDELIGTPTPNTRVDATQTTTYRVTQTINGCTSPKSNLTYTVNVTVPPLAASPVDFCQTQPVKQLTAVGASLKWYDPSGNVTTGLVTTAGNYSVTQTSQGCESRKAEVRVTISPQASATLTGAGSATISQGSSATLTLAGTGSFSYTLLNETTGTVAATGTVLAASPSGTTVQPIVVTPGATATYKLQSITNGCGAGIASGSVLVTVINPTITTGGLSTTSICAGSPLSVSFTSTGTFAPGNTFAAEIALITGTSNALSYLPLQLNAVQGQSLSVQIPPGIGAGQYLVRVNASNATYPVSGTVSSTTLTVRSLPTASISTTSSTTVNRVSGKTQPVELFINLSGERPWSVTYTATTTTSRSQSTTTTNTNPYRFTVTPDTTTTYRVLTVSSSNGCGLGRIEAPDSVRITVQTVTGEADPFSNTVKVYPVPTDGTVTVDIDLPLPQPAQLRLTNAAGQTTQQLNTRQRQTTLSLDKEPGGVYLLYIKIGDKWTVRRILKQ